MTQREERKQKKRDHWKLTQFMDYGEKVKAVALISSNLSRITVTYFSCVKHLSQVKDAFTRRDTYERRIKAKEERMEKWRNGEEVGK